MRILYNEKFTAAFFIADLSPLKSFDGLGDVLSDGDSEVSRKYLNEITNYSLAASWSELYSRLIKLLCDMESLNFIAYFGSK